MKQTTLWKQLYRSLLAGLADGSWPPGSRLPSSRELAHSRGLSRSTVVAVYEQLAAEGLVESRGGSGTFAAGTAASSAAAAGGRAARQPRGSRHAPLPPGHSPGSPPAAASLASVGFGPLDPACVDFRSGLPDLEAFPLARWHRAQRLAEDRHGRQLLAYGPSEGLPELRQQIARYLARARGWPAVADNIVIASGTTQAIGLVARLMARLGKPEAWVEDPVTRDIPLILESGGLRVHSCPVEADGMSLAGLPARLDGGFVYVTPSHQFPTGCVLSLAKRRELLARSPDIAIVEDDYDSEFRYGGPPLSPLVGLDPQRVIHLGTFSKTLAPGLRIAWLHLPDSLIALARGLKWLSDLHNPPLLQASLAQFMEQGWYELHLRRMRALYRRKRDLAIACLGATGSWTIEGDAAGIHLMVRRRRGPADDAWAARCRQRGVRIYPLGLHRREAPGFDNAFILGFGHLSMDQIVLGCERLNGVPD